MNRRILAMVGAAMLLSAAPSASALTLQISIGEGALVNPKTGAGESSFGAAPLTTELLIGYNIRPWLTIDLGIVFAYDVFEPYYGTVVAQSYYAGVRPGIHAYFGTPPVGLRPYFRAAFPILYDNVGEGRTHVGLLLGGGLEYKLGLLGIFAELIVSPYFNQQNLIPIEGRIGVAIHL